MLDDQPLWVKTAHGPDSAPCPIRREINDITMMVSHHHESRVFNGRTRDAFDRLFARAPKSTPSSPIGVHPYVTGQSHRIKYFEELYAYINSPQRRGAHGGGQDVAWYARQVKKPKR